MRSAGRLDSIADYCHRSLLFLSFSLVRRFVMVSYSVRNDFVKVTNQIRNEYELITKSKSPYAAVLRV